MDARARSLDHRINESNEYDATIPRLISELGAYDKGGQRGAHELVEITTRGSFGAGIEFLFQGWCWENTRVGTTEDKGTLICTVVLTDFIGTRL